MRIRGSGVAAEFLNISACAERARAANKDNRLDLGRRLCAVVALDDVATQFEAEAVERRASHLDYGNCVMDAVVNATQLDFFVKLHLLLTRMTIWMDVRMPPLGSASYSSANVRREVPAASRVS